MTRGAVSKISQVRVFYLVLLQLLIDPFDDEQLYFTSMILSYFIIEVANRRTRNGSVETYNLFDFEFGCFCTGDYCNSSGILETTTLFLGMSVILCIFK